MAVPKWQSLQQSADQARKSADHKKAVELYTQALALPKLPWGATVDMSINCADCCRLLGQFSNAETYLSKLAKNAAQHGDDETVVKAYDELLFVLRMTGDFKRGLRIGKDAVKIAKKIGQANLIAEAVISLGFIQLELGEFQDVQTGLNAALSLIAPDNKLAQIKAYYLKNGLLNSTGKYKERMPNATRLLELARSFGDRHWEGIALNSMAISQSDMVLRRSYFEQAAESFKIAGDLPYQAVIISNISDIWSDVGLYKQAYELAQCALDMSCETEQNNLKVYCLLNLGGAAEGLNDLPAAINFWNQSQRIAKKNSMVWMEHFIYTCLGNGYMLLGQVEQAKKNYDTASTLPYQHNQALIANFLALQAGAHVLAGDTRAGRHTALQALKILEKIIDTVTRDISEPVVAWWCYRAFIPASGIAKSGKRISHKAWHALELGIKGSLLPIQNLSDTGLRRGYLHRNVYRRLLILEYLNYAPGHGISAAQMAEFANNVQKPGRLDEVFNRLLRVGIRLNAERDPARLPGEIVDEVDELTGAERIALVLLDEQGKRRMVKTLLPLPPLPAISRIVEQPADPDVFLREIEPWLDEVSATRQGFIRQINEQADLVEQRSLLVVPLISQGKLVGIIYSDLRCCFGRFDPEDLNLLGVLANQSAVALENADWSATLEQKVDQRTKELKQSNSQLEQRTAELTIINRVQEGLVRNLDFQAIIDLVGDELMRIFHAPKRNAKLYSVFIALYDQENDLVQFPYWVTGTGKRLHQPTVNLGQGLTSKVIQTGRPLVLKNWDDQTSSGSITSDDGLPDEFAQSWMGVPILTGDKVTGVISVQDPRKDLFSTPDVRLLSTLAASLGVALENARLFDETQRLLKETEQRNAELAIINSVQAALAAELNIQGIYDAVGDKIREIFHTGNVDIRIYDPKTNLLHYPYEYEAGVRITKKPEEFTGIGFQGHVIRTRETLVINENMQQAMEKYGSYFWPGTLEDKSNVWVPLVVGDQARGLVCLSNYERENAFSDSDVRLLQTLVNSMSVALENARLFDETQRLYKAEQERVSELEIINSIQQGLAAELDFQHIINLVGDKLREVFKTPDLGIRWYDEKADLLNNMYNYEHGQRLTLPSGKPTPGGAFMRITRTHQPIIWNTGEEGDVLTGGVVPGTDRSVSGVMIPVISSDRVLGLIQLENYEREHAYGESELRLLTTIAASLGSALENARLFDETQRLLKETEQRNAELAILNQVGDALSKQLDVDAIIKIVGDQVRDTFKSEVTTIHFYDPKKNLITPAYAYDRGYVTPPILTFGEGLTSHVIRNRQPLLLSTAEDDEKLGTQVVPSATGEEGLTQSYIGVPIIIGENIIGVVSVQSYTQYAYQPSHVSLLSTLASSMGVAIANARQFQAEQERVAELQIINTIQQGLAKELDFQAIVDLVGDKLRAVFNTGDLGITWFDEKANVVHYLYTYEHGKRLIVPASPPDPGGIYEYEMETRQPYVMRKEDVAYYKLLPGTDKSLSGVYIPIISSDRFLGDISIENFERENAFGESEIRLLTTIAASFGTALENARLFAETQRLFKSEQERVGELEIINSIQKGLAAELDFQAIIDLVGDKLREVLQTNDLGISWYDENTNLLHNLYSYEHGKRLSLNPLNPVPGGVFEQIRSFPRPMVANTSADFEGITTHVEGTDYAKSAIAVPIISSDRVLGLISIENFEREYAFKESEQRLLTTIAASLGTALENARLFDETQRLLKETEQRNAELAIINSVQAALAAELNIQGIYDAVGDKIRQIFHSENLGIRIYDPKTNLISSPYLYERGERIFVAPVEFEYIGFSGHVMRTRETLVINENIQEAMEKYDSYFLPGTLQEKSLIFVPLVVGEQARGLVSMSDFERENAFSDSDVRLLQTLVNSLSVALENARLFDETQRLLAETEQRAAELAILNSVGEAMARQLDIKTITHLVGDKVREIFSAECVVINLYEPATHQLSAPYCYDKGYLDLDNTNLVDPNLSSNPINAAIILERKSLLFSTFKEQVDAGAVVFPNAEGGAGETNSYMGVPIIVGEQVRGLVSVQSYLEHAYDDSNLRLLSTLAASMGVAIENARLFQESQRLLEETQQRNSELAIINSVQAALAAELNIQGIYDAVGDKIREIFHSDNLDIIIYDPKTNLVSSPYLYERGERILFAPVEFKDIGFSGHVMRTRKTLVINENIQQAMEKYGSYFIPGTLEEKSAIFVPLVVGEQARGLVSMSDFERENAFSDSDVRLLQTLVNSLSVALENARLFDETQRLLAETEQRNAELAIINSVQAALAAELNIQGIYDVVGDKIREIFHSDSLSIRIYDPKTTLLHYPYLYEAGMRVTLESEPFTWVGFTGHVLRTRETLVINEDMTGAREKFGSYVYPGTKDDKSAVFVPLIAGDQVRGVVSMSNFEREHAFSDSDIRLLQTLVNSMSVALENARLFNETQRLLEETSQRASELAIINRVSQSMSSQLAVEAIVRTVGDQVRDSFHSEVVNIYMYDPVEQMIHLPYSYDRKYVESGPFPYGSGLTSKVIDNKKPLILGSFEEITGGGALLNPNSPEDELMPQSYLGVPIIVGEKAIGVIDVQSYTRFVYGESHVRLLSTLASSMGVALENARLFEETRRLLAETEQRNRELAIISRIGNALAGQLDPQGIYELVGEELQRVFDAQVVAIISYDRQENLSHWRYSIEKGQRQNVAPHVPAGFSGEILRTRQPLLFTRDVAKRAAELGSKVLAGEAPKSYLGVPLIAGGEVTGVITLQNIDREEAFNENDLRLLSTLALSMGVALENARLYQETQHHAQEMAALAEIGSDIASTHEMEPVLERLATKTRELMQVRDIALYLVQPDGHTLKSIVSQGKYADETKAQLLTLGQGITGSVAQRGIAEIINDPVHDPRAIHIEGTPADEEEPECFMVAPLISRGFVIGVMSVYRDVDQGLFTQLELDFLVSLARQAAIAIDSARLYTETERRATEMAALAEVSREISATLELQVVLDRIADQARDLLAAGNSAVYLLQSDGETIKAIAAKGEIALEVLADEVTLGAGIIGSIVKNGVAEWVNDTASDTRALTIPGTQDVVEGEKLLVAPLLIQDRAIGALAVWREPDDPLFIQAELSFAIGLAQQAVVAIENARLFETAQESERLMADIINFLPDSTLVIDKQGSVIAWNHAIEEMTGVKADEIVGKGDYEYALSFYGERRPILIDMVLKPDEETEAKYLHIQRNEGIWVGETLAKVKGQTAYLNATASVLKNSRGEVVGAIESIRDITDQKKAEKELQQAKLEAEAANQAKSSFLAMMSHEIRTPMNAIIGMSGLLMDTSLNPDQREFAETIRSSGDSLLTIINDILDFSKIEAGKMTLEEVPFDLRECMETAMDLIKIRASEKRLELAYHMEPGVPPAILGDVTRLRQVLINLLGNSIKFTEQGEIVLTVAKGEQKGSLQFSVRDTGIGIPSERVSQLFRPFTQADASTSRRYGGTGLGLALSNRIVEMMGGRIWVESEGIPGKGSTFHFTIFAKPAQGWKGQPHLQGVHPQLRGKRLLVVDDNATNRRLLQLQTQTWGMLPSEYSTPAEALEVLRKGETFDLAILDMHMPDMSGVELATEIRKLEAGRPGAGKMPVVLSTSLGGREEAREANEFTAVLLKPIRQSALFDTLIDVFASQAKTVDKPSPERVTLDPGMASRHPLRILLAEDNVVNQKLALRLLSQMGYRADVAANGLEVLQAVKRQMYDAILMDVQMPEMDGLEATRRLCAEMSAEKRPRIIAMTANAMQGDREMCLEAGMDDYLSKPIRVEELVNALYLVQPHSAG